MHEVRNLSGEQKTVVVGLSVADFEILEKFRGDLTPEAFFSALLRMIDSGAVMNKPEWIRQEEKP